jgi:hypothetical protein
LLRLQHSYKVYFTKHTSNLFLEIHNNIQT